MWSLAKEDIAVRLGANDEVVVVVDDGIEVLSEVLSSAASLGGHHLPLSIFAMPVVLPVSLTDRHKARTAAMKACFAFSFCLGDNCGDTVVVVAGCGVVVVVGTQPYLTTPLGQGGRVAGVGGCVVVVVVAERYSV